MFAVIPTTHVIHHCRCGGTTFRIYEMQTNPGGMVLGFAATCTLCGRARSLRHQITHQDTHEIQEFATPEEAGAPFTKVSSISNGSIYECDRCKKQSGLIQDSLALQDFINAHHMESPECQFTVTVGTGTWDESTATMAYTITNTATKS